MFGKDIEKPLIHLAAKYAWLRGVVPVAKLLETPLKRKVAVTMLVGLLVIIIGATSTGVFLQYHYGQLVTQNERFAQYEHYLQSRIASMSEKIGLLSDEVADRRNSYRRMIAILEACGTDIPVTKRQDFVQFVYHESMKSDLDPILAMAVIKVESTFDTSAVSSMGAVGLMQILPYVGKYKARQLGIAWKGEKTLKDPYMNVRIGLAYLMELAQQFGDFQLALEAYNRGPSALRATMTAGITPNKVYARRVLRAYTRFQKI